MSGHWSDRRRVGVVVLVVAIMLAIPLAKLSNPPARFAWQMFNDQREIPPVTVVDDQGRERRIYLAEYVGVLRNDVQFDDLIARHLCANIADSEIVLVGPTVRQCR